MSDAIASSVDTTRFERRYDKVRAYAKARGEHGSTFDVRDIARDVFGGTGQYERGVARRTVDALVAAGIIDRIARTTCGECGRLNPTRYRWRG